MTDQEQINSLKAQVNCLRESIRKATVTDMDITEFHAVLKVTPEQCLAEVKAKAIEEMVTEFNKDYFLGSSLNRKVEDYAKQLREQVTVSDQLDLATKIMTVTI